jgi:hypothetical protein
MILFVAAVAGVLVVLLKIPVLAALGGLALTLVLPGLALVPRRVAGVEWAVLVPALSLAVVVLGGLVLFVAGIRLGAPAWALLTGAVTAVAVGAREATARWGGPAGAVARRTPADERRWAEDRRPVDGEPGEGRSWVRRPGKRTIVVAALVVALLGGAAGVSLTSAHHQWNSVAVTELSIVPATGNDVRLDVSTSHAPDARYRLEVTTDGGFGAKMSPTLGRDGKWERMLTVPPEAGRITAELYRDGSVAPYRTVFLDRS